MSAVRTGASSTLLGSKGYVSVSRGIGEFNGGRPALVTDGNQTMLVLPVEGLTAKRFAEFKALSAPASPHLILTERRARSLGIAAITPIVLPLTKADDANAILSLVSGATTHLVREAERASQTAAAAIQLMKLSQALPAVLAADVTGRTFTEDLVVVEADAVGGFAENLIRSLTIASEASIPLTSGTRTRFVVFRDAMGATSTAIVVGKPDFRDPVVVRLHSACLTGDVFGSRRCDCGDQLRLAVARLADIGGGVVLYLAQEGRGLGLANKMRTYQLQDEGLDTVDANTTLGFDDDERDYGAAARMLQMLNCTRVLLMTNNPAKLEGLTRAGIEIAGRVPLEAPINSDNLRYLTAKAERAGHRLDQLMASLAEPPKTDVAPLAP